MNSTILEISERPDIKIQTVHSDLCCRYGVDLDVMRLDQIDEELSGNKWFKLKYNLIHAFENDYKRILSFGGYYSNHLHALAAAGKRFGFETIGVVRGEDPLKYGPTLQDISDYGMRLKYISRASYRDKTDSRLLSSLNAEFGDFYLVPEGGSNTLGVKGCKEIVSDLWEEPSRKPDYIVMGCGTGATLAGVVLGAQGRCKVFGISALKGAQYLHQNVLDLISGYSEYEGAEPFAFNNSWQIFHDYHFGGFAKLTPDLVRFMDAFSTATDLPIEPVYVGKALYAVHDLIREGIIPSGSRVLLIHTGGLQGVRGMEPLMQKLRTRFV
ncbi:MAG: pyridoxal-phosphate dependent enzyme [Pseudomonadales bacterium]|nr:pyridoxal-phosphate dependent enzyme [Pseudomonadales bacterium]